MISDPVSITGFILQSISQIAHFSNNVRKATNIPKDVTGLIVELHNASKDLEELTFRVRRALLEARVTPGSVLHPSLESTLGRTNHAFIEAYALLGKWARRVGLQQMWDEAAEQRNDASLELVAIREGKKRWCLLFTPSFKVMWYKICHVQYGAQDVKQALDKLSSHRHDLYILSSGLPFNFSLRLRGLENILVEVWADGVEDPKPMVETNNSIHHDLYKNSELLGHSYDTRYGKNGYAKDRLIVIRYKNEIAHDHCREQVDKEKSNLEWIVKMMHPFEKNYDLCKKVGLLPCEGYFTNFTSNYRRSHALSFVIPPEYGTRHPRTLRHLLLHMPMPSLTDRVRIAQSFVTSVVVLHTFGIVHRFLNPESAVVFPHEDGPQRLGDLYLLGFSQSRVEQSKSGNATYDDDEFRTDLYTHFDILANPRRVKYTMKHDIFALGVCLLEIALWRSAFVENKDAVQKSKELKSESTELVFDKGGPYAFLDTSVISAQLREEWVEHYGPVMTSGADSTRVQVWAPDKERIAHRRRELLVAYAKKEIPPLNGQALCDVVVSCLEIDLLPLSPSSTKVLSEKPVLLEQPEVIWRCECETCRDKKCGICSKSNPSPDTVAKANSTSEDIKSIPGTPDSVGSSKTLVGSTSPSSNGSTPCCCSKVDISSGHPSGTSSSTLLTSGPTVPVTVSEKLSEQGIKQMGKDKNMIELISKKDDHGMFVEELVEKQKISGEAGHTIHVARTILQKLEKIHI